MYGNSNNSSRVFELQQSISSLKQDQGQSFLEHFGAFKQKWEELRQYRPIATTVKEYIKREEQDQIFYLLAGLTADFEEVRRDILMRADLPSLNTVCAIIQSEETRKRVMGNKVTNYSQTSENFAHLSSSKVTDNHKLSKGKDKKGSRFFCDHYNRSGHSKDRCFVLYPHLKTAHATRNKISEANLTAHAETDGLQCKLENITKQLDFLMKKCGTVGDSAHAGKYHQTT
ncbi:uncharacterized protein A4U43_C08F11620 [Asparagus officinalis]|nr:uncharacterized protein A4U43_C08F11620 [Asparagus officinalis]